MSKRTFKSDLSVNGIENIIGQLVSYEDEILIKAEQMIKELSLYGIKAAKYSVCNAFKPYVDFMYSLDFMTDTEVEGNLVGEDNTLLQRVWYNRKGQLTGVAYISPIMMSEFGAGPHALEGHRGTFPSQKHAFDEKWFWRDEAGKLHPSDEDYTMVATQPMYHAFVEMIQRIDTVAKEVFGA